MHKQEYRGRPLQVKVSSPTPVKRAATVISQKSRSESTEPESLKEENGRAARTLGLMNIPDTVNDSRIRALAEPYGSLVKIVLRPDREGAIVEFADVKGAGKASLELDGREVVPGRPIRVGSANDLLRGNRAPSLSKSTGTLMPQIGGPIKRPTQPGARIGGRRGGLGFKRGGSAAADRADEQRETEKTTEEKPRKTNDDFRAMLQNGK
jgi:squamous cell carcinoma antigen recognized by T-cells 3